MSVLNAFMQRSLLRRKAVYAVTKHGFSQKKACEIFGFSKISMSKYIQGYRQQDGKRSFNYKKRGVKLRTGALMTEAQETSLIQDILSHTPDELDLNHCLWTSKVVNKYLQEKFSIIYSERGIRKLMNRLVFFAKAHKASVPTRSEENREMAETYYIQRSKYELCKRVQGYIGEMRWGRGSTYGLIGKTPVIKKTGSRFKCNLLAAISPQGFMNWMIFDDNFTSQKFIEFLGRLIRQIKQKVFLIVDNHQVHHSKKVQSYIEKHQDKLELFFLPPYCPDMNPQELANQDVKSYTNNFKPLMKLENLMINVRYYLATIQFNPW